MSDTIWAFVYEMFGIGSDAAHMTVGQITLRAIAIYLAGLVIVRIGEHRFLGKHTAFDIILGFILGSVLSRAVNGGAPLLDTVVASALLVALHWLFATAAFRWHPFGRLIKGSPRKLIEDGRIDEKAARTHRLSRRDLEEALRTRGGIEDFDRVHHAWFERSGDISIIPREEPAEPKVVEVEVREGVQRIRIELG